MGSQPCSSAGAASGSPCPGGPHCRLQTRVSPGCAVPQGGKSHPDPPRWNEGAGQSRAMSQDTRACSIPGQAAPVLGTGVSPVTVPRDSLTYLELKKEVKGAHANGIQTPGAISQLRPCWHFPRPPLPQGLGVKASGDGSKGVRGQPGGGPLAPGPWVRSPPSVSTWQPSAPLPTSHSACLWPPRTKKSSGEI